MTGAIVRSKIELLEITRSRAVELQSTRMQIDDVAGFTAGYASKILGPGQVRTVVNESLWQLLWSLGLRLRVEVDPDATQIVQQHYSRRRAIPSAGR
ncbi:MAG: hypothetical protein PSV22_23925 [Pseudolabrys sp.]|nr:hypothetical protein [Pseudolabrys sp.]